MYQREGMGRLTTIPGVGPITAAAVKALVADIAGLKSARHFAAWTGFDADAALERRKGGSRVDLENGQRHLADLAHRRR
jgi:transposase